MINEDAIKQVQSTTILDALEEMANIHGFMTTELGQFIQAQRERLTPRTPQQLRQDLEYLRRKIHTPNELARGMDDYDADTHEELRQLLLRQYPYMMGDYIMEFGQMVMSSVRSDLYYYFDRDGSCQYYEIWREFGNNGVTIRCQQLARGTVHTMLCGTSYEVPHD